MVALRSPVSRNGLAHTIHAPSSSEHSNVASARSALKMISASRAGWDCRGAEPMVTYGVYRSVVHAL